MNNTEQKFLTHAEYQELARRYLLNILRRKGQPSNRVDNQDILDYIVTFMMRADEVFDGRGNREGFRWQYAIYGYRTYLKRYYNPSKKNQKLIPMSTFKRKDIEKEIDIAVDNREPSKDIENNELKQKIMNSLLSDYEKESIIGTYFNNETQEEIAERIGVARGYISMLLKTGLRKLEKVLVEYK